MKKILFVNYSYALGSTGNLIKELQERLDPKEFYSVTVCKKTHPFYQDRKNILIPGNRIEYLFEGLMSRQKLIQSQFYQDGLQPSHFYYQICSKRVESILLKLN